MKKRILPLLLCLCLTLPLLSVTAFADTTYNQGDVNAVKAMMTANGLQIDNPDDPGSWGFAKWNSNGRMTELHLFDKHLTGTLDVSALTELIDLECSDNELTALTGVEQCTQLYMLDCRNNQLTALPSLTGCTQLAQIYASDNQLATLPDFSACTALRYLEIGDNRLTVLPDLTGLLLSGLSCGNNPLTDAQTYLATKIPDTVTDLSCNGLGLTSLDAIMPRLTNLRYLVCSDNQLTSLPALPSGNQLWGLDCNDNQLTALPDLTGSTGLLYLECEGNRLTTLPDLSACQELQKLYCDGNQLTSLPNLTGFTKLKQLGVSGNPLTNAADDLATKIPTSLDILDCSNLGLTSLDTVLLRLTKLTRLYCSDNQLTSLPDSSIMEALDCSNNQLTSLPMLGDTLGYLDCRNNKIAAIDVARYKNLMELHCGGSALTRYTDVNGHTCTLSAPAGVGAYLSVDGNRITVSMASPNDTFTGWTVTPAVTYQNGTSAADSIATFLMTADTTVTANFAAAPKKPASPATGDSSMIVLWGTVLMLSAGGAAVLLTRRKKED
ncbi:MAG: LPXTG cell wall anchor domain-containing protein [Clostridiales bacterium]|nr:LPXTG cell wall anchor domain-containing protein [Clostridiales bacterium]